MKQTVAVIFGGRSTEHDVSVISALQVIDAIDTTRFETLPVYIAHDGQWYSGDALYHRHNYPLKSDTKAVKIDLCLSQSTMTKKGVLKSEKSGFFEKTETFKFDIAFPVLHGTNGEDGAFQGLMEMADIPYAGLRLDASTLFMNKILSKNYFEKLGAPVLPAQIVSKPSNNQFVDIDALTKDLKVTYPVCVKPNHLGSSIGVHKCESKQELQTALLTIFALDTSALIEPFIENLVEYNVAVKRDTKGNIITSAIEKPVSTGDFLDFKDKYKSGSGKNKSGGSKLSVRLSQGMVEATRSFNPDELKNKNEKLIRETATKVFDSLNSTGAPRFDFYGNAQTGDIWLNEINPMPGSYGYFLWEAAENSIGFTQLITSLIEEGLERHTTKTLLATNVGSSGGALL